MAKIVKTEEVEIGLEEIIRIIKKNWNLLAGYLFRHLIEGKEIVRVEASFNLVYIGDALRQAEGLIADATELAGVIAQIFREIEHQNPHFKNMAIGRSSSSSISPLPRDILNVFFDIDIAVVPVMPVGPMGIPGPDNPVDFASSR